VSFQAIQLQCSDCKAAYTFSVEEQEAFALKGHTHQPKRCPACREARKSRQSNVSSKNIGNIGYGARQVHQMFAVKCSACGKDTQVPFEPRQDKPVYCFDCYRNVQVKR
jgi:CxxC-x17-CxxC domain-containing protein